MSVGNTLSGHYDLDFLIIYYVNSLLANLLRTLTVFDDFSLVASEISARKVKSVFLLPSFLDSSRWIVTTVQIQNCNQVHKFICDVDSPNIQSSYRPAGRVARAINIRFPSRYRLVYFALPSRPKYGLLRSAR